MTDAFGGQLTFPVLTVPDLIEGFRLDLGSEFDIKENDFTQPSVCISSSEQILNEQLVKGTVFMSLCMCTRVYMHTYLRRPHMHRCSYVHT